jgi:hypothetical protein
VGSRKIDLDVPRQLGIAELSRVLGQTYPELVGRAIQEDLSGLLESFTLNLNGISFVDDGIIQLKSGDSLLLFSSQAGG